MMNTFQDPPLSSAPVPDFLLVDAILFTYRIGAVRYDEQKKVMLEEACTSMDAISFLNTLAQKGIGRNSRLARELGKFLSAPNYYRALYGSSLGIRSDGVAPEPFLGNQRAIFLVEPLLNSRQQKLFFNAYWWFVHNHQPFFNDVKRGRSIGVYATDPQDNASALERFDAYLLRQVHHQNKVIQKAYADFPADIVMAVLRRAFL